MKALTAEGTKEEAAGRRKTETAEFSPRKQFLSRPLRNPKKEQIRGTRENKDPQRFNYRHGMTSKQSLLRTREESSYCQET